MHTLLLVVLGLLVVILVAREGKRLYELAKVANIKSLEERHNELVNKVWDVIKFGVDHADELEAVKQQIDEHHKALDVAKAGAEALIHAFTQRVKEIETLKQNAPSL